MSAATVRAPSRERRLAQHPVERGPDRLGRDLARAKHDRGAGGLGAVGVVELVRAFRQQHERDPVRERAERRAGAAMRDNRCAAGQHMCLWDEALDADTAGQRPERAWIDVPADRDERRRSTVQACEQRTEARRVVEDGAERDVDERRLELVQPCRRRPLRGGNRSQADAPAERLLPGEGRRGEVDEEAAKGAGVRIRLEPEPFPDRLELHGCALEHRERDHRAEGVVDRRDPERGGHDRGGEVAAVVDDHLRSPPARNVEQLVDLRWGVDLREHEREELRATSLRAEREDLAPLGRSPLPPLLV